MKGSAKVITLHPEGNMNIWSMIHPMAAETKTKIFLVENSLGLTFFENFIVFQGHKGTKNQSPDGTSALVTLIHLHWLPLKSGITPLFSTHNRQTHF